jgi:phosphoglycolate phosphatase
MSVLKINGSIIETVIFDFDGTLAKLNIDFQRMREEVVKIIASYGIQTNLFKTNFVLEMINLATDILNSNSPQKAKMLREKAMTFIENIELRAAEEGELFAHTRELLTFLKAHNISRAVVSRNCEKAIFKAFPDILSYCDAVVCRDLVKNVKPNPHHLHTVMEKIKGTPTSTLMVGDHPLDIETGRQAGTFTAGVLTGHFQEIDFLRAGADLVLPRAVDLIKIFS